MTMVYLVQHGEKERLPGDPGLTQAGRQQAARAGQWLRGQGIRTLYASPLRRAQETAECIASVTGLAVHADARLRERLNWDGRQPYDAFLARWARTRDDRDFAAVGGESSRQAGARLMAILADLPGPPVRWRRSPTA
jgi:broad specificity phosphatase PhoE